MGSTAPPIRSHPKGTLSLWTVWLREKIRDSDNLSIASLTAEEARKSLEEWVKTPIFVSNISNISTSSALLTGSSPRFNVFGNDFGSGRPLAVLSGAADKTNGRLTMFPGVEE
ncbi:hypothetical protein ACE6H2_024380 [Prunus campanulata]